MFLKKVAKRTVSFIKNFTKGLFRHAEMAVVLTTSAIGINAMVSEAPFMYSLPMWIEGAFVIPFISILGVSLLVKSAEVRNLRYSRGIYA